MRLDAHQHFWMYSAEEYGWIDEASVAIRKDFLPRDLKPLLEAEGFAGAVAVQARQTLEETEWLLGLGRSGGIVKGVVGWVDLCSPSVREQLERFAGDPLFVGVRHIVQGEPRDDFVLRKDFQRGIAVLREFGLTYDLLLFPRHLPYAVELVRAFPDQPFVLDHLAKPDIRNGQLEPWARDFRRLAALDNVYCKLSGMVTEADWYRWTEADFRPYLDIAFEAFGPDHLMIGSDWPVCTVSRDYSSVIGIVKNYLDSFSDTEREKVLGENCARFYGIPAEADGTKP